MGSVRYTGNWYGLYKEGWKGDLVPEAYAHPAKFRRGLIRQIYDYLIERGYLRPGDTVVDPFGGIAAGALDAMRLGLVWIGVELEQKFVNLGKDNILLWQYTYGDLWPDTWGRAHLYQGDSRELARIIRRGLPAGAVVSSPPWVSSLESQDRDFQAKVRPGRTIQSAEYGTSPGQLAAMPEGGLDAAISSPPFGAGETRDRAPVQEGMIADCITRAYTQDRQGTTPGNLAHLETTDEGLDAVVSSPPYAQSLKGGEGPGARYDFVSHSPDNAVKQTCDPDYGDSPGQLAAMPEGDLDGVVSSPPFEQSDNRGAAKMPEGYFVRIDGTPFGEGRAIRATLDRPDNLGNSEGDNFWSAAFTIADQCYKVLKPGAVAVWVVKRFVRDKEIVDFPDQWRQMCEAAGFETVEWIRAWNVAEHGEQLDLFGGSKPIRKEYKGFFRRHYEQNCPENRIDWEDVLIMRRLPEGERYGRRGSC